MKMSDRCLGSLFYATKKSYLSMNSAAFNYKMKEAEEASGFKLTTEGL